MVEIVISCTKKDYVKLMNAVELLFENFDNENSIYLRVRDYYSRRKD